MGRFFRAGASEPDKTSPGLRRRVAAADGFTLIESMVAMVVLVVGMLGAYLMLNVAVHATSDVRAREGAVSLARQITEGAQEIPFSQISSSTIVTQLQTMPGLANSTPAGPDWTIVRNGVTYTVSVTEATYNDAKDSTGAPCSSSSPCDFKQVTVTVSWTTYQGLRHQVSETATMTRAGQDPGFAASGLQLLQSQWNGAGIGGSGPNAPVITSSNVTALQFQVTAPAGTTAIVWSLNGAKQTAWNGSAPSSGTTWVSSPWPIPTSGSSIVYDGTYKVSAQAEDANGVDGPAVAISVRLIRSVPSAPNVTGYGFNPNFMTGSGASTAAELQWSPNPELNVVGYDVINPSGNVICQTNAATTYPASCGASAWCSRVTVCVDMNPPAVTASNLTYKVVALYYDTSNNLQQGTAQSVTLASGTPTAPSTPATLTVSTQPDESAILTWPASSGSTSVSFYRIYRGGADYSSRYDTIPASSCSSTCSYHDTNRTTTDTYYVTAVGGGGPGSNMAESPAVGPASG